MKVSLTGQTKAGFNRSEIRFWNRIAQEQFERYQAVLRGEMTASNRKRGSKKQDATTNK